MEQIRSFIAIELPDGLRRELDQLETQLKSVEQFRVKWVNPASIHLTLKFLGNIAVNRVGEIIAAMEEAARGIPPFRLEVKDTGVFPGVKRARVAWVGLNGDIDRLLHLQKRLESGLKKLGFASEGRAFTPHLTLARVNDRASPDERQRFGNLITGTVFKAAADINVNGISLMKSQLTREGAIYSRLGLVELKNQRE